MKIQCRKDLGFLKDLTPVGVHGHPSICGKDLGFLKDLTPVGVLRRPSPPLVGLNGFLIFFFFFFFFFFNDLASDGVLSHPSSV